MLLCSSELKVVSVFSFVFETLTAFFLFWQSLSDVSRSSGGLQSKRSSLDSTCLDSSRDTDSGTPFNSPVSANKPSNPDSPTGEIERYGPELSFQSVY
jgi:hypothetical protein